MTDPKILRGMSFFDDLNDNELAVISGSLKKQEFKTRDVVFKESEDGDSLYVIRKGEVKACKTAPDGERLTLVLMKDGDIFGEMSFLDGRARTATIVAMTDLETYVITKDDFEKLVDDNPRLIYKVLKSLVFHIHSIVRGMNTRYLEMVSYMWGRKRG
ncbi:MAG: cyclic nucleotide-binding domain-containing protein [Deltaproteobacteria bacterium]|nr:cyclic nucleotide-binding domain-containing protein [Deltaproteobacteria bacterium]